MADGPLVGPSDAKKPWESKTVLVNAALALIGVVAMFYAPASSVADWINGNGVLITSLWGVLNVVLRLITKDRITLTD